MTPYTVEHLLEEKALAGINLVAGHDGRTKEITNVNIIDNPDTYDWFVPRGISYSVRGISLR